MTQAMIVSMILYYSQMFGVSPELSLAVAKVESDFNPSAVSKTNDFGVFQLQAKSFPRYSKSQLLNPRINIRLGIEYLSKLKNQCVHKYENDFLVCWNYGIENAKRVKYPRLFPFVKKVNTQIKKNKLIDFKN